MKRIILSLSLSLVAAASVLSMSIKEGFMDPERQEEEADPSRGFTVCKIHETGSGERVYRGVRAEALAALHPEMRLLLRGVVSGNILYVFTRAVDSCNSELLLFLEELAEEKVTVVSGTVDSRIISALRDGRVVPSGNGGVAVYAPLPG